MFTMKFLRKNKPDNYINKADLAVLLMIFNFFIVYLYFVVPVPIAPDEQVPNFFSSLLYEQNKFEYSPVKSIAFYSGFKIAPNGFNFNPITGNIVGTSFPGFIFLSTLFKTININIYYVSPILSVLGLLLFYVAIKRLLNRRIALIATALLGISPIYLQWSTLAYQDMSSLFYFFLLLYLFTLFYENKSFRLSILIGFILGWWIFMRYTNAIYLVGFITLALFKKSENNYTFINKESLKNLLVIIISFSIVLLFLLIFNKTYYNSYITIPSVVSTGETLDTGFDYVSDNVLDNPIIKLSAVFEHAILYFDYLIPLWILIFLSVAELIKNQKIKIQYILPIVFTFIAAMYFFYTGTKPFYWKSAHYSYYRYLLPIYPLLILLFSTSIINKNININIKSLIVSIFVILSVIHIFIIPYNAYNIYQSKLDYTEFQDEIEHSIPIDDTVILSGFWTKLINPKRDIVYMDTSGRGATPEEFPPLIDELLRSKKKIFLIPFTSHEYGIKKYLEGKYCVNSFKENKGKLFEFKIYKIEAECNLKTS